jgi:hypothetical protein
MTRFNNIGIEPIQYLDQTGDSPKSQGFAIVKYHPNRYYGLLQEYLSNGWVDKGEYITSQKIKISKDCFSHLESNYVLAFVYLHQGEEETCLESVGDRPLYIEESERNDFFKAYQTANNKLVGINK